MAHFRVLFLLAFVFANSLAQGPSGEATNLASKVMNTGGRKSEPALQDLEQLGLILGTKFGGKPIPTPTGIPKKGPPPPPPQPTKNAIPPPPPPLPTARVVSATSGTAVPIKTSASFQEAVRAATSEKTSTSFDVSSASATRQKPTTISGLPVAPSVQPTKASNPVQNVQPTEASRPMQPLEMGVAVSPNEGVAVPQSSFNQPVTPIGEMGQPTPVGEIGTGQETVDWTSMMSGGNNLTPPGGTEVAPTYAAPTAAPSGSPKLNVSVINIITSAVKGALASMKPGPSAAPPVAPPANPLFGGMGGPAMGTGPLGGGVTTSQNVFGGPGVGSLLMLGQLDASDVMTMQMLGSIGNQGRQQTGRRSSMSRGGVRPGRRRQRMSGPNVGAMLMMDMIDPSDIMAARMVHSMARRPRQRNNFNRPRGQGIPRTPRNRRRRRGPMFNIQTIGAMALLDIDPQDVLAAQMIRSRPGGIRRVGRGLPRQI